MQQMTSIFHTLREEQTRKTFMWVLVAVSVLALGYGAVQVMQGHQDYQAASDDLDKITAQFKAFNAQFPTVEVDGVTKPDLTDATEEQLQQLQVLGMALAPRQRQAEEARIEAYNKRAIGLRIVAAGVIGLALAYVVAPPRKKAGAAASALPSDSPPG